MSYEVHDTSSKDVLSFPTFKQAKKKFDEIMDEYDEVGLFRSPELRVVKISDVMYKVYGRDSGFCHCCIYIKKVA